MFLQSVWGLRRNHVLSQNWQTGTPHADLRLLPLGSDPFPPPPNTPTPPTTHPPLETEARWHGSGAGALRLQRLRGGSAAGRTAGAWPKERKPSEEGKNQVMLKNINKHEKTAIVMLKNNRKGKFELKKNTTANDRKS